MNMYESPVHLILQDVQSQMDQEIERTVINVVRKFDVDVDKDELIKTLNYDRNQYTKGYKDGINDTLDKIKAEIIDTGAHEQEVFGRTEFLRGINYCLGVIDRYKAKSEASK